MSWKGSPLFAIGEFHGRPQAESVRGAADYFFRADEAVLSSPPTSDHPGTCLKTPFSPANCLQPA